MRPWLFIRFIVRETRNRDKMMRDYCTVRGLMLTTFLGGAIISIEVNPISDELGKRREIASILIYIFFSGGENEKRSHTRD